jgi:predicted adenine nucleotide alpha hydrolase (AANH) superfamily ATPase
MNLLFHCCCGPCTAGCLASLAEEGVSPRLFWYNPNIHPWTEYQSRRDSLAALAGAKNLNIEMIDEYGLRVFIRETWAGGEGDRCGRCYATRLEKTASFAAQAGFDTFSTSLLVSPYQNHDAIRRTGEEMARRYGVAFLYRDFRPRFREGQAAARGMGLYMQKYCGCVFSEEERYAKKDKEPGRA